ncbi:RNA repair transcriptional activator RtcR [Anatilimnocola floriformis]|uniref:RNA repair transcriptional activator RtcR n=1 Tax=Anatilimnocola floriformis TaxID=2948575 RepID=UPI0020C46227|nr:RNA repair transcriptional activator RtcR [Anatilimnocola floriformis]
MNQPRHHVVIGIVGSKLDAGLGEKRWNHWRPSVALCQYDDLLVERFELLHHAHDRKLAEVLKADIESVSPETTVRLHELPIRDPWDFEEVFGVLYQFARNTKFKTDDEDYLIHITTGSHVQQICLFLLAESRHLPGKLLQTSPPNPHRKDDEPYSIIDLDLSRYDALATRFAQEHQAGLTFLKSGIETRNKEFNQLIERIERVAIATTAPLLLTGPTGAGKSHLARKIYELKRQREQVRGEFVECNCATLRGDQAMSALFGHVKGAFTGATNARGGLLKGADGGVLFLDEIGELGSDEQAMLLRAIEEKRFLPVGADKETSSDFQLLAGTNRDLAAAVAAGHFRDDLLARINLWTFRLPGLAQRREDIEPNLDYELERYATRTGQKVTINKEARQQFVRFAESPEAIWSANFRDLNAAVTRMATLAASGRITVDDVAEETTRLRSSWTQSAPTDGSEILSAILSDEQLANIDLFDRAQLATVIRICRASESLSIAGRQLFAVSRLAKAQPNDADRLRKYLARFGLTFEQIRE